MLFSAEYLYCVCIYHFLKKLLFLGFDQVPQLTSSRLIDVNKPFKLINDTNGNYGTRRAVMIGINYVGKMLFTIILLLKTISSTELNVITNIIFLITT